MSKIGTLKALTNNGKPFFEALWGARQELFGGSEEKEKTLKEQLCELHACITDGNTSSEDRFAGVVVYHIERLKLALCEKQILRKRAVSNLQRQLKTCIQRYNRDANSDYVRKVRDSVLRFYLGGGRRALASERIKCFDIKKPKLGLVLVKCGDEETMFVGSGLKRKEYLNFDFLVSYKDNFGKITKCYVDAIKRIQGQCDKELTICFRKKYAGAKGSICMKESIQKAFPNNPFAVYSQITGEVKPLGGGRVLKKQFVLCGDIVITGNGLREWKRGLSKEGYNTNGIVIFADFSEGILKENCAEDVILETILTDTPSLFKDKNQQNIILDNIYDNTELNGTFPKEDLENAFSLESVLSYVYK